MRDGRRGDREGSRTGIRERAHQSMTVQVLACTHAQPMTAKSRARILNMLMFIKHFRYLLDHTIIHKEDECSKLRESKGPWLF